MLTDPDYKTPMQNMYDLFVSAIKLAYPPEYNFILQTGEDTEASKVIRSPSFEVCVELVMYQKNVSILLADIVAERNFGVSDLVGENSEHLVYRLEYGVVYTTVLTMIMFRGDTLMRGDTEIIDRVVKASLYAHWFSGDSEWMKLLRKRTAIIYWT